MIGLALGDERDRNHWTSRSNSDFLKRYSPVGVRLGLSRSALIHRRRVGMLTPRWRQAAAVLIQGSDSVRNVVAVSLTFMFVYGRTCAPMTLVNLPAMRPNAHAMHPAPCARISDAPGLIRRCIFCYKSKSAVHRSYLCDALLGSTTRSHPIKTIF